ncbi:hypothetical protein ACNSOP_11100 [Aliarcobacter lanthieri]|uniref:hypothetical protein n=1 Tax=Arcobacteraceae TaxID=2808963 RepID=UPI000DE84313|nr:MULTISPECIES: hypothetical protein [Arcobacteraceae]MBL3519015.1 hypothetical protein [Aliarcobacter lanthieri]RBQ26819.1 hypothetical protein CRU88_05195 [Arcobacter sp. CECT 9188]
MEIIKILNDRIDNLLYEHEKVKLEKIALEQQIQELIDENDKLERNNQDMMLKIESTLTLIKAQK